MLQLQRLSIVQFRNLRARVFEFSPGLNALAGDNGVGKTNVLDGIYYLSFTKSYFNPIDGQNIAYGADFFALEGDFLRAGREEHIFCGLRKGQRKVFKKNQKSYERLADHVGQIPLVLISPGGRDLILEGSEARRKFVDGIVAQSDRSYLRALLRYNRLLSQRNALLKHLAAGRGFHADNTAAYDAELSLLGGEIFQKRRAFLTRFTPVFQRFYARISQRKESVAVRYVSQLEGGASLGELLEKNAHRDRKVQHTTVGVHRDDLDFLIGGHPIKRIGSQGQQKSFLIALKLAQFQFVEERTGLKPLLLLDDIFDKLDENRVAQLIGLANGGFFGQVFVSDTHPRRIEAVVKEIDAAHKLFIL